MHYKYKNTGWYQEAMYNVSSENSQRILNIAENNTIYEQCLSKQIYLQGGPKTGPFSRFITPVYDDVQ